MFWAMTNYHPEVAACIGRILAGYPEVEYSIVECLDAVRDDYNAVFKRLFSIRGETRRVETANTLGRPLYQEINLGPEFGMTFDAIRHLLRIRNQYAHAHWLANKTGMSMADMEELARSKLYVGGESKVSLQRVTPEIVQRQEQYGDYVNSLITWLTHEARIKKGKVKVNEFPKPKRMEQPPLYKPKS